MTLTKNDLAQIGTVINKEITATEKRLTQEIEDKVGASEKRLIQKIEDKVGASEKRLTKKIEDGVGDLAAMTKRGFDVQDEYFARQDKKFDNLNKNFLEHDSEMVHKSDHYKLKERVGTIETKLGLVK